jgi:hypothetical protein
MALATNQDADMTNTTNIVGTVTLAAAQTIRISEETACNFMEIQIDAGQYDLYRTETRNGVRYSIEMHGVVCASYYLDRLHNHASSVVGRGVGRSHVYRASIAACDMATRVQAGLDTFFGSVAFHDADAFAVVDAPPSALSQESRAQNVEVLRRKVAEAMEQGDDHALESAQKWLAVAMRTLKPTPIFAIDA